MATPIRDGLGWPVTSACGSTCRRWAAPRAGSWAAIANPGKERAPLPPLTETHPGLTIGDAYAVQLAAVGHKVAQGAKVVGKKIGLTSKVMQQMFAVDQPDYGHLLDTMAVKNGGVAPMARLLQPRVEGEIAFLLKRELRGG